MSYKVDNAIIFAAGLSSRFAPISYEIHKGLISVKGEVLIERQIRQLKEVGIDEIVVIVGYKKEKFEYLKDKYGVILVENPEYYSRNTNGSMYVARDYFKNSYICLSDNYFTINPFENEVDDSYYAVTYSEGKTDEWCVTTDSDDIITDVKIGGENAWYMVGHSFFSKEFSEKMIKVLLEEYDNPETYDMYWEDLYVEHIDDFKLKARKYDKSFIFEFDNLDELRTFDERYIDDTGSKIMKCLSDLHNCNEGKIKSITPIKDDDGLVLGINYFVDDIAYQYFYSSFNN